MRFTSSLWCVTKKVGDITKKYANLPEAYIKRTMEKVEYTTPNIRSNLPRQFKRREFRFNLHRPWTDQWAADNDAKHPSIPPFVKVFVEPIKDWTIFKGDRVQILVGKDAGKLGIVSQVIQERNWIFVQGMNWKLELEGKMKDFPGIYTRKELPLLINHHVVLVDPTDEKPTTVEWRYTEEGERVRVSERTGRVIPMPAGAYETFDYKTPGTYMESEKDTKAAVVEAVTFNPQLKTFEMEIMEHEKIEEDRIPKRTYWY